MNPFDQFDAPGAPQGGNVFDQFDVPAQPAKVGQAGFGDALKDTLKGTDWVTRNWAGAGTALSDLYQGAKQFFGAADPQQLEANQIIKESAPIGTFAGNAALASIPFGSIANGLKGAALVGAGYGALNPVEGDQSAGNIIKGKLINTGLGAVAGAGGQLLGDKLGQYLASKVAAREAAQQINKPIDQTLKAALDEGFVAPPTQVNPTWFNQLRESVAGKKIIEQTFSNKNADVADALARRAVGLGGNDPLTSDAMQQIRKQAFQQGYAPIANLGTIPVDKEYQNMIQGVINKYQGVARSFPGAAPDEIANLAKPFNVGQFDAGDALQASQFLRDQASQAFRAGDTGLGKAAKDIAKGIEDQIERSLSTPNSTTMIPIQVNGQQTFVSPQDLLQNFRDARQLMAKAHTVEDAIVEGGGTINARKLAQRVQAGKPLTDELATIGNFANNFSGAMKPRAQVGSPGVSALNAFASLMSGGAFGMASGPIGGAVGLAAPAATRKAMQVYLASQPVQKALLNRYGPSIFERGGNALANNLPVGLTVGGMEAFNQ